MVFKEEGYHKHLQYIEIAQFLKQEFNKFEGIIGKNLEIVPLCVPKIVEDSTEKFLIRERGGWRKSIAFLLYSSPVAPELVANGVARAECVRSIVGGQLGEAIIKPITSGHANGRSYAIFPYCNEISSKNPICRLLRHKIKKDLLHWLREVTKKAVRKHSEITDGMNSFTSMLQYLDMQKFVKNDIKKKISRYLGRIGRSEWKPNHSFDHNDLWYGNIMIPKRSQLVASPKYSFVLIDWYGANPKGYGMYDLIRFGRNCNLSDSDLRKEVHAHSVALECDIEDTIGHLLSTLAKLHQNIGYFPENKFIEIMANCLNTLERVICIKK
jgi:thiamine kinase-like enzyme